MPALSASQKQKIIAFVKARISGNDAYHDFSHVLQVAETALWLAGCENADKDVCWAAAMLHDICKNEPGDHAEAGAKLAKEFLGGIGTGAQFSEWVCDAIHFHNKDFDSSAPLERQILWDSDKLFILTPRGFKARMLPYWIMKKGKEHGILTSIHEYFFYRARFHTKTAIQEVARHAKEMEDYLKTLKSEV